MEIYKEFTFDAAHSLPRLSEDHQCRSIHGHTFRVIVHIRGPVDPEKGWVTDYGEISRICRPVVEELDHSCLNEIPGLENPTSENLAVWIWKRISPGLSGLCAVEVKETASSGCIFRGRPE